METQQDNQMTILSGMMEYLDYKTKRFVHASNDEVMELCRNIMHIEELTYSLQIEGLLSIFED